MITDTQRTIDGPKQGERWIEPAFSIFLTTHIAASTEALHAACHKMPRGQFLWRPCAQGHRGRSAFHQLGECAVLNYWAADCLQQQRRVTLDPAEFDMQRAAHPSQAVALDWLLESAQEFTDAVRDFPASDWHTPAVHPITEQPCTWAEFTYYFIWNMTYHQGQISYIHTLYGDESFDEGEYAAGLGI